MLLEPIENWRRNGPLIQIRVGPWLAEYMETLTFFSKESYIQSNVIDPIKQSGVVIPNNIASYFESLDFMDKLIWGGKITLFYLPYDRVELIVGISAASMECNSLPEMYRWLRERLRGTLREYSKLNDINLIRAVIDREQITIQTARPIISSLPAAYYNSVLNGYRIEAARAASTWGCFVVCRATNETSFRANISYQLQAAELCHPLGPNDACVDGQMHYNAAVAYHVYANIKSDKNERFANYSKALEQYKLALACSDLSHHHPFMFLSLIGIAEIYYYLGNKDMVSVALDACEELISKDADDILKTIKLMKARLLISKLTDAQPIEQAMNMFYELLKFVVPIIQKVITELIIYSLPFGNGARGIILALTINNTTNNIFNAPSQTGDSNIQVIKYE